MSAGHFLFSFPLVVIFMLSGCGTERIETPANSDGNQGAFYANETLRAFIGPAAPYPVLLPDEAINANMQIRRTHAWRVFERINQPVPLNTDQWTAPIWQTWYDQEEFGRIFRKLFAELTPAQRRSRSRFSEARVDQVLKEWGETPRFASFEPVFNHDGDSHQSFHGRNLGGVQVARTLFSPEFVKHYLLNYSRMLSCSADYVRRFPADYTPPDANNFSLCYDEEFPMGAVMIKAVFLNNNSNIAVFDSSASTLRSTFSSNNWPQLKEVQASTIPSRNMFTVAFSDGSVYRLAGMHISTKEVREWVWATFWWSETPAEDFGADRDEVARQLDPEFRNYKMCTATHFNESDRDPSARFRGRHDTLAAALDAAARQFPGNSWCANPYLEGTFPRTNCIGCHQQGGTSSDFDTSLSQRRRNFPSDFTFSFGGFRTEIERGVNANPGFGE